jgi:hypothetical protein
LNAYSKTFFGKKIKRKAFLLLALEGQGKKYDLLLTPLVPFFVSFSLSYMADNRSIFLIMNDIFNRLPD